MFYNSNALTKISGWYFSSVTDMSQMFMLGSTLNQDIGGWDVSGVTNMEYMFR